MVARKREKATIEVTDYLDRTEHLSMVQHGALGLLLRHYYTARRLGQDLPCDARALCRMVRAVAYEEIEAVEYVAKVYFTMDDNGHLKHVEIDEQVMRQMGESERTRRAAKARWDRGSNQPLRHAPAHALAMQVHTSAGASGADASAYASASPDAPTTTSSGPADEKSVGTVLAKNQAINKQQGKRGESERGTATPTPSKLSTGDAGLEVVPEAGDLFGSESLPELPKGKRGFTIRVWLDYLKARGEKAFEKNDPIFAWANSIDMPHEFVALAWAEFKDRHLNSTKHYNDWKRAFRNAVKDNWYKLWWCNTEGKLTLTSQGELTRRRHTAE